VKLGQQLGQDLDRATADHADRHLAAHEAGELVHSQAGVRNGAQSGAGERKHGRSYLGEVDRPARAIEQLLAELGFQAADLRAHARLRNVYPAGA
jgi:hypothetical protein